MKTIRLLLIPAVIACVSASAQDEKLIVHEWGTFTTLQDETGRAIGGINSDDEPVPSFVHNLFNLILDAAHPSFVIAGKGMPTRIKGRAQCHPDVTMRLETPVIYFHPESDKPLTVDVHVGFRRGWLTQFYPEADASVPGGFGRITAKSGSTLEWKKLRVGDNGECPATEDRVWLAPRAVHAAPVATAAGEHEKFLFYRGVANLNAPLRVERHGSELRIGSQSEGFATKRLWLVRVAEDGRCAWRPLGAIGKSNSNPLTVSADFSSTEFAQENVMRLEAEMRRELVAGGLFDDEAEALLNTWQRSYFRSPGLRLFFFVPKEWTEAQMPLRVSATSEITRVMVGRIELVTPEHRALLKQIGTNGDAGAYQKLGRFRNALVLDEQKQRPTEVLDAFIKSASLEAYQF